MTAPAHSAQRDQVLVHFYRAVVMHMDVWRQRMDATTNWAAATSAVMITFALGNEASPHFVLVIAFGFDLVFLLMESRRYQIFDLWRRRFRLLNRYLIVPALLGEVRAGEAAAGVVAAGAPARAEGSPTEPDASAEEAAAGLRALANDLGHLVPRIRLASALGYRLRRNYGYLILVVIAAWMLKLEMHPTPAAGFAELVRRGAVGPIAGQVVLLVVGLHFVLLLVMALFAPSERMRGWRDVPSPILRLRSSEREARADARARGR
jgi:uncharacterized membrane protein